MLPKKYLGESAVVVDERGIDPLAQQGAMPAPQATNYVATQVDVITSHNVALKVVDRMKLTTNPDIIEKFQEKTGGIGVSNSTTGNNFAVSGVQVAPITVTELSPT